MAYNLLKGKKGIIFGALNDMSIAWKVAERAHEEGAQFVLTNTPVAMRLGSIEQLAAKCGSSVMSSTLVASQGITVDPHFAASCSIVPKRIATGVFVRTNWAPSS